MPLQPSPPAPQPSPVPARPEATPNVSPGDLATGQLAPLGAVAAYEGLSVAGIQFEGPPSGDHQRLLALVEQPVGAPLDKRKVRESVRNLYATGRFSDVEVQAQRQRANEVVLVFRATENYFIGVVSIEGVPDAVRESQLINATKLELGELFTAEKVESGLGSMKDVLEDYGYFQTQVEAIYADHPETQQKDITFRLAPGDRARVGNVRMTGDFGLPEEELRRTSKLKPGKHVAPSRETRALRRLRSKFQKKDRLVAEVSIAERKYQPQTNTVDYLFRIDRGPTVDIHLQGAKLRKGLVKKYVPVYEENAVDDSLLSEGRRNLRDYFQTKGYFDVGVTFTQEREGDHLHVIYEVERGERHRLKEIAIEGNEFFSDEDLLERMQIEKAGWLLFYGRFSQSMLNADVQAIARRGATAPAARSGR
jgi:outer membrane protein assembly factor BamA